MNVFFKSQFNYCRLIIWMCYNRPLDNKLNRLHERYLRIKKSSFEELLESDGSASIHHQNIKFLAIEMFKVFKGAIPQIMKKNFSLEMQYFTN